MKIGRCFFAHSRCGLCIKSSVVHHLALFQADDPKGVALPRGDSIEDLTNGGILDGEAKVANTKRIAAGHAVSMSSSISAWPRVEDFIDRDSKQPLRSKQTLVLNLEMWYSEV